MVKFAGGRHKISSVPCWYVVHFDTEKGMFRSQWWAVDQAGRRLEDFAITESKLGGSGWGETPYAGEVR